MLKDPHDYFHGVFKNLISSSGLETLFTPNCEVAKESKDLFFPRLENFYPFTKVTVRHLLSEKNHRS